MPGEWYIAFKAAGNRIQDYHPNVSTYLEQATFVNQKFKIGKHSQDRRGRDTSFRFWLCPKVVSKMLMDACTES